MNSDSFTPFSFEIPEKKTHSFWTKGLLAILAFIFITIPLAEIDSSTFKYNEVYYQNSHDCSELKCFLTSCQ